MRIPLSLPWLTDAEDRVLLASLHAGGIAGTPMTLEPATARLRTLLDAKNVLLTTSCTSAMELALFSLDLQPGDEVIVPDFTFVSTANAVLQAGGTPVFADVDPQTCCIDIPSVLRHCSPKTRCIMPVHYNGVSADMDALIAAADDRGVMIIEDAAHGLGASFRGRALGTIGAFGALSFHHTKNYVCGEGGALIVNDPALLERIEYRYDKGTDRLRFLRGEVPKYTWVSEGSSYALASPLAAILAAQLERLPEIRSRRKQLWERYQEGLKPLADAGFIRFQQVPDGSEPSYHIACMFVSDVARRDSLLSFLQEHGIDATFHYAPLHRTPFAESRFGPKNGEYPGAVQVADSIVRLPLFPQLTDEGCEYVARQVTSFFKPSSSVVLPPDRPVEIAVPELTIVVPCYNEAPHIVRTMDTLRAELALAGIRAEYILIDDRSTDDTAALIEQYAAKNTGTQIRVIRHAINAGRGSTVAEGIRLAKSSFVGFLDIDLEIHPRYIPSAVSMLRSGADIVVGNRHYNTGIRACHRYVLSRGYRLLVRLLLGVRGIDTEAGFKFFRREKILPVLAVTRDPRWFWDTEIVARSIDAGLNIESLPVMYIKDPGKVSTVKVVRDSLRMLGTIFLFAWQRGSKA